MLSYFPKYTDAFSIMSASTNRASMSNKAVHQQSSTTNSSERGLSHKRADNVHLYGHDAGLATVSGFGLAGDPEWSFAGGLHTPSQDSVIGTIVGNCSISKGNCCAG